MINLIGNKWRRSLGLFLLAIASLGLTGSNFTAKRERIPILGFHDIIDLQNPAQIPPYRQSFEIDYTKQDLEKFLEFLIKENYWFLSAQDLYIYFVEKSQPIPAEYHGRKPIMLTFDDGYQGIHENALPILEKLAKKYNRKGKLVLFINPRTMGMQNDEKEVPHTTCEDLREGYQKGFYDIQSHGYSHEDLTKLKGKALDNELGLAKFALRKCLHDLDKNKLVAAHIAYPYGAVNKSVEKALKPYYISGFLYDDKFVRVNRINNKMRISRLTINNKMTAQQLIEQATTASTLIPPTNQLDNDDNSKNPKVSKPRNRRLRNRKR